jgi:hypothetical protein
MNTLEERVRAATRAAADTVPPDSVPPLVLPAGDPARSRGGARSSASLWGRRLAPLGAAVAVVAVAIAMVTLGQTAHYSASLSAPASPAPSAPSSPGPVRAGPPVASYVASGQVPPYFVSIEAHGNPNFNPSYAVVRATATGAALSTIAALDGGTIVAATAAADDRTFILDEQPWVPPQSHANQFFEPRSFVTFRLNASGQPGVLTRLGVSVPSGALMTGFALSPDGSQLAIAVEPNNVKSDPSLQQIRVYSLATGAVRTWSADGTIGFGADDARSLSWADDEHTLAFDWEGNGPGVHVGVWLLDLRSGGGDLLADSRQAVSLVDQAPAAGTPSPSVSTSPSASPPSPSPSSSPSGSPALGTTPTTSPSSGPDAAPVASASAGPQPTCQEDSIITPDGAQIVCGAIAAVNQSVAPNPTDGVVLQRGAETEFFEFSAATGKVTRTFGDWTFGSVGALTVEVLWSNASGSVLIGAIPDAGGGRIGVISGNEFTPLSTSPASASPFGNTF